MISWKWFIVEGVVLFVLGILAIASPGIAAEAIVMFIGWLLLFVGCFAILGGVTSQSGPRAPVSLGGGLFAVIHDASARLNCWAFSAHRCPAT